MYHIVYIALGNLDDKSWFGTQRFASALSGQNKVFYIERPFTLFEVLRGRKPVSKIINPVRRWNKNLLVFSPFSILPFSNKITFLKKINIILNIIVLRALLDKFGFKRPIMWLDDPFENIYIGKLNEKLLIYNCLHEYSFQPNRLSQNSPSQEENDINWFNFRVEKKVLPKADIVFCETPSRVARKKKYHPNVYHIPHGVDYDFYSAALKCNSIPADIKSLPKPIIGFIGTVNQDKFDFELLGYIAAKKPEWSFVHVGRIYGNTVIPSPIRNMENVYFLGEKRYSDVPLYVKHFDVCTIPYKVTRITEDIQTVKIYEYLAMGKPVVTNIMKQLLHLKDIISMANSKERFLKNLEESLKNISDIPSIQKRLQVAKCNSWQKRAQRIEKIISEFC